METEGRREFDDFGAAGPGVIGRNPGDSLASQASLERGGQYAGRTYRGVLRRAGMRQRMSRAGNCYDNAFLESCVGAIRTELELDEYEDALAARVGSVYRVLQPGAPTLIAGLRDPA